MKAATDGDLKRRFGAIMDDALLMAQTRGATFPKGLKNQLRMGFGDVATQRCRGQINEMLQLHLHRQVTHRTELQAAAAERRWRDGIERQFVAAMKGLLDMAIAKGARLPRGVRSEVGKRWGANAAEICFEAVRVARKVTAEFGEDLPATLSTGPASENGTDGG